MDSVLPPRGSLAEKNLLEAGQEKILSNAYKRMKIEKLAKLLVDKFHSGNKFANLNATEQQKLRIKAAAMLNSMNGGKRRKTRSTRKRRHTSLKRK